MKTTQFGTFDACAERCSLSNVCCCSAYWSLRQDRISSSSCFFIGIVVSSHRELNECTWSFFNSTFKISVRFKTDSSAPPTLKCSKIIHVTCRSFFSNGDSSCEVSVDDVLETTGCCRIMNFEVCLPLGPGDGIRRLQIGNRLRGLDLDDPYHCFNRTTCTRGYLTPEIHSPYPEV